MTVKEIFELRKRGQVEAAYEAIRPIYAVHKGRYTTLCMFWVASDVFKLRVEQGRIEEAEKIYWALKRLVPLLEEYDRQGTSEREKAGAQGAPFDPSTSSGTADPSTFRPFDPSTSSGTADPSTFRPFDPSTGSGTAGPFDKLRDRGDNQVCLSDSEREKAALRLKVTGFMRFAESKLIKESEKFRRRYFAIRTKKQAARKGDEPEGASEIRACKSEGTCDDSKFQKLLEILDGELSVREMMARLGFGSRDKFLKNYLYPALKAGVVEMTQPESPRSPRQKYRIRERGD